MLHSARLWALVPNIRLDWKNLPGRNTLVYYENPEIMVIKSFTVQATDVSIEGQIRLYQPLEGIANPKYKLLCFLIAMIFLQRAEGISF